MASSKVIRNSSAFLRTNPLKHADLLKFSLLSFNQLDSQEVPGHLKFNIGGTPYRLSFKNVKQRGELGLLHRFFTYSHARRLKLCDDYDEETKEYYFERPAVFFNHIYTYYVTGLTYRPSRPAMNVFFAELSFWGLTKVFFPELNAQTETIGTFKNEFNHVRFGSFRKSIWDLFEVPESSVYARIISGIMVTAVLLSNFGLILGSMSQFQVAENVIVQHKNLTKIVELNHPHFIFDYVEMLCIIIFTIEYLAKILTTHNRFKVFIQIMNLVDLVVIFPFYIELVLVLCGFNTQNLHHFKGALLVMRILRIARVIRLFKLGRHSAGMQLCGKVVEKSLPQLSMVAISGAVCMIFFSALVYFAEKDQPNTKFESIPATCWWTIITMTTVGYGDMVPDTIIGKLLASITICVGVLVCALPVTVMVDNFVNEQQEFNEIKLNKQRKETITVINRFGITSEPK